MKEFRLKGLPKKLYYEPEAPTRAAYVRYRIIGILRDFGEPFSIRAICRGINGRTLKFCNDQEVVRGPNFKDISANWCRNTPCEVKYQEVCVGLRDLEKKGILKRHKGRWPDLALKRKWDTMIKIEFLGVSSPLQDRKIQMKLEP